MPQTHRSRRAAYPSLLTAKTLGSGEETVTITEFSNGNGSLAAPRKRAKKRAQDPGADHRTLEGWRPPAQTMGWGAGGYGLRFLFPILKK